MVDFGLQSTSWTNISVPFLRFSRDSSDLRGWGIAISGRDLCKTKRSAPAWQALSNCCDKPFRCLALRHPGLLNSCVGLCVPLVGLTREHLQLATASRQPPIESVLRSSSGLLLCFLFAQHGHRHGTLIPFSLIQTPRTLTATKTRRRWSKSHFLACTNTHECPSAVEHRLMGRKSHHLVPRPEIEMEVAGGTDSKLFGTKERRGAPDDHSADRLTLLCIAEPQTGRKTLS